MREYAKLAPTFWTGTTGKALRRRGSEGVIVALYLVSSPHSNMIGLYYQPVMYMAHETGLGIEGASKGLQDCIECGFCSYDNDTEMVFVHEMAAWQIADSLSSQDKRCKGIQKDYDALPECPFLGAWFDRYVSAFSLTARRSFEVKKPEVKQGASQAPSKPHRSQEQEQEQEQESPHTPRAPSKPGPVNLATWLAMIKAKGQKPIPEGDPVLAYADEVGLPLEFLTLAWREFRHRYSQPDAKRYRDWRSVFRKAVRGNWLKLWYLDGQQFGLTTVGLQAQRAHAKEAA